jgi:hypothetical protein
MSIERNKRKQKDLKIPRKLLPNTKEYRMNKREEEEMEEY